jgi:hypothetical protein
LKENHPMELITTAHERTRLSYLTCCGRGVTLTVTARCSCGWSGPTRPWGHRAIGDEQADLDAHLHRSRHHRLEPGDRAATHLHLRCGHVHSLHDDCAVAYDSPAGQLQRACQASLSRPLAALDRLTAATALVAWAAHQQDEAVIAARLAGVELDQIAAAAGLTRSEFTQRWGQLLDHLEKTGLVDHPARSLRPTLP